MAKKQNYSYKTRRADTLANRMMIVFALLIFSVCTLLFIRNRLDSLQSYELYFKVIPWIPTVPFILTAISAVVFFNKRKTQTDESFKVISSSFVLAVCAVFFVVSLMISRSVYSGSTVSIFTGFTPSIALIVLVSLLYFVAVSFPGSYLVVTVFNALGAFAIYALHFANPESYSALPTSSNIKFNIISAFTLVAVIVFCIIIIKAKTNNGELMGVKIMKPDFFYPPLFIAIAVLALFIVLGILNIGSYILFDVIIALETIVFALFYAIKMLK